MAGQCVEVLEDVPPHVVKRRGLAGARRPEQAQDLSSALELVILVVCLAFTSLVTADTTDWFA